MSKNQSGQKRADKVRKRKRQQKARASAAVSTSTASRKARREQADELFEQAMDSTSVERAMDLLDRAVELDPGHIDAWVELAEAEPDIEEAKVMLQTAIRHGRKELREDLERNRGMFWGLFHTRPFMRAKHSLACLYRDEGDLDAATEILEEMLVLNEVDNQGVRWELMEVYLRQDQVDEAEQLAARFPDEATPFVAFTALLIQFRKYGDSPELRQKLQKQAEFNQHIIPRLLDPQTINYTEHPLFSIGSPEEADLYCQQFLFAWRSTSGAISWLRSAATALKLNTSDNSTVSAFDIKKEIQRLRTKVKKLPQLDETWYAETSTAFSDDGGENGWILTILDADSEEPIFLEPGEGDAPSQDGLLFGLLQTMLRPETGEPRRPVRILLFDHSLFKKLNPRLGRLGIAVDLADSRPEVLDFIERGTAGLMGHVDVNFDEIKTLPVLAHSWVIDWKQLPIVIPGDDGAPENPNMLMVVDEEHGIILGQQLVMGDPQEDDFSLVVRQATQFDQFPEPARPQAIVVRSPDNRVSVAFLEDKLGVPILVGDCAVADEALEGLSSHLSEQNMTPPSLLDACDGDISLVADFYEVADDFFKTKIWLSTPPETIIKVSCPNVLPGDWYAVTMGQMGQEIGILFFDDVNAIAALHEQQDFDDPGAGADHLRGISFSLNEEFVINPDEVAAVEQFGWPVSAPEAWPSAFCVDGRSLNPVNVAQLRFLSIAIKATTARLLNALADGSVAYESAGEMVTVAVEKL